MERFTRWVDRLLLLVKVFCLVSFSAYVSLTLVQVVNRYALNLQMYWSEEVILLLFIWSVMMAVPVALWHREEIVVDIVSFPPGWITNSKAVVVDLCSITFLALLAFAGWQLIQRAGHTVSPALSLPRSVFYWSIPVSCTLAVLALLLRNHRPTQGRSGVLDLQHAANTDS